MESAIDAVEKILNYNFKNKKLLKDALTHPSYTTSESFERLEFVGDAALGLAFSNYVFLAYPTLDPGQLSLIRAANISTEKLARVAIKHGLFQFVRHNATAIDDKVKEFAQTVSGEDDGVVHGGSVKAPKILADIVESVAASIYVDTDFDLQKLWVIFRSLLEPIVTLEDLRQQPQPVTTLFEVCQSQGKNVDIKYWKKESKNVASVYVDGEFITSGSSEHKEIAKLNAVKGALYKLWQSMPMPASVRILRTCDDICEDFGVGTAKQKLNELCGKRKWTKPTYRLEKDEGPPHEKIFASSVQISTEEGLLYMMGDEMCRIRDAENSAAYLMIHSLQESNYL